MNQVLINLGFVTIYWYSAVLFVAFLIGGAIAINEAKKWKISEDFMVNLFFYVIIFGLLGARLYYVLFNLKFYNGNILSMFKVWEGGLAIHGGLIFGALVILIYSKKYKVNTVRIFDILAVSMLLGQAIGRWGNFFNGEAHGAATTLSALQSWHLPQFIINGMYIDGVYYIPTFLMESIWCLIGFVILYVIRSNKYTKLGQTTCLYMIWYGIGRFVIELFRTDSLMIGNFKVANIISVIMIIVGGIIFNKIRQGSIFANKYNDMGNTNEDIF